jgi:hypothetical protein
MQYDRVLFFKWDKVLVLLMALLTPRTVKRMGDAAIALGILTLLTGLAERAQRSFAGIKWAALGGTAMNYNPSRICNDAWGHDQDHSNDRHMTHLSITLQEGCFSPWITLPRRWTLWHTQLDRQDGWVVWLLSGMEPQGPYYWNDQRILNWHQAAFRLQGRGTITIFVNVKGTTVSPADGGGRAAPEENTARPVHEPTKAGMTKQVDGIDFTFEECKLWADTVTCTFQVTNRRNQDLNTCIGVGSSRLIDSNAVDHKPKRVRLGKEEGEAWYSGAFNTLVSGVPLKSELLFEQVPSSMTLIKLIEISGCGLNRKPQFFDVPVSQ